MRMTSDPVWRRDGETLVRDFEFGDFRGAMAFVNRVADAADEVDHHPDILIHDSSRVRLTLATRSEGRVTASDHALAQRIDGLVPG
jgi:4a-hydroxytetrahydrobiopterin dehydratase